MVDFKPNNEVDKKSFLGCLQVNAVGLRCPLPLLKAKQALRNLPAGEKVYVVATDAGSVRDFHAFTELTGATMVAFFESDEIYTYVIQKN